MEIKDVITALLSVIALAMSAATLYLTQFRRSKVMAAVGPMVHLFYVKPSEPTVFLPVVFHNSSPTKAIVYKIFLEIEDTKGVHFALKWIGSVKIDLSNNYTDTDLGGPFKIDGYETIANALRFFWFNDENNQQLDWLEGDYLFTLHIWMSEKSNPDYSVTERLRINSEVAKIMAGKKATSDNTSRFIPFEGKALLSFSSGKVSVDFSKMPK